MYLGKLLVDMGIGFLKFIRALQNSVFFIERVAGVTGLEPATSGVTGRRSNQLSYTPVGVDVR